MDLSTVKSVIIGVGTAAAVIAITGAASGSGVGGVFNLGKTNKVNATSSLTGSTNHSMLSVTNSGAGAALSLHVGKGKAPLSVNSSKQVAGLNASLLGGLAAGQFVQGGGQSRAFGFSLSAGHTQQKKELLSVPGFGTLKGSCTSQVGGAGAEVDFITGSHGMDDFIASLTNSPTGGTGAGNDTLRPNTKNVFAGVADARTSATWQRRILRYATGSGRSQTVHIAVVELIVDAGATTCDFDASAIIGPGVSGP